MSSRKPCFVIGATGAEGMVATNALLSPSKVTLAYLYGVRALTSDPDSRHAKGLETRGMVVVKKGTFDDFSSTLDTMQGAYGVLVNNDGFTVGKEKEVFAGMRIYELAK